MPKLTHEIYHFWALINTQPTSQASRKTTSTTYIPLLAYNPQTTTTNATTKSTFTAATPSIHIERPTDNIVPLKIHRHLLTPPKMWPTSRPHTTIPSSKTIGGMAAQPKLTRKQPKIKSPKSSHKPRREKKNPNRHE